jgi:hypothetical protein
MPPETEEQRREREMAELRTLVQRHQRMEMGLIWAIVVIVAFLVWTWWRRPEQRKRVELTMPWERSTSVSSAGGWQTLGP